MGSKPHIVYERIRALIGEGLHAAAIAERTGCSRQMVYGFARREGLTLEKRDRREWANRRTRPIAGQEDIIRTMIADRRTAQDIVERLKVNKNELRAFAKAEGLTFARKGRARRARNSSNFADGVRPAPLNLPETPEIVVQLRRRGTIVYAGDGGFLVNGIQATLDDLKRELKQPGYIACRARGLLPEQRGDA